MSEAETKIQSAIWELVTTEVYYILALQTVTDVSTGIFFWAKKVVGLSKLNPSSKFISLVH